MSPLLSLAGSQALSSSRPGCGGCGRGAQPRGGLGGPRAQRLRSRLCACPDLYMRVPRDWLARLDTSAPPPTSSPPHPLPPCHATQEIRKVTTNSSCRKPTNPPAVVRARAAEGVGLWVGGNW